MRRRKKKKEKMATKQSQNKEQREHMEQKDLKPTAFTTRTRLHKPR